MRLAVERLVFASSPRPLQKGLDIPVRQPAHQGPDDEGLELFGPGHPDPEQLIAERRVRVTKLRGAQLDRPEGGLDGARRPEAVSIPDRAVCSSASLASPAELLETTS